MLVTRHEISGDSSSQVANHHFGTSKRFAVNAALSVLVLAAAAGLLTMPGLLDRPLIKALNDYGTLHPTVNAIMFQFDVDPTYSGIAIMTVIWWCWFNAGAEDRVRLLTGTLAAFPAGIASRFLQHRLSSHPRPAYDVVQHFHLPHMVDDGTYNTWNSFPSDHAAVFFGLVVTIYVVRPRIGLIAGAYLAIIETSRMFMGAHYFTDLLGGAALASAIIWAVQGPFVLKLAEPIAHYERTRPAWFYATAFMLSYQLASLFATVRYLTGGFHMLGFSQ